MSKINSESIDILRGRIKSAVIFTPDSNAYAASIARWSETAIKPAGVVVQPLEPADISTSLLWAQEYGIDVAVKGGGHSTAGTSSSDGGLVIDMSRMNKVEVDPTAKTINAQGGAIWKDVDEAGAAHGLATVGGTVNHTGVGGLTLGGGYGWLSGQYGLTIDNQAYDQANLVFSGVLAFTPDKLEDLFEQLNLLLANPDSRSGAMIIFAQGPDGAGPLIIVICFYNGSAEAGKQRFAGLLNLEPVMNTLDMIPYSMVNSLQNPQATYGGRKSFKGVFYEPPLDPNFARTIFDDLMQKVGTDPDLSESAIILEFIDMRKVCATDISATAFASRNSTQNGIICLRWYDKSKDSEHRAWARYIQAKWKSELDKTAASQPSEQVPQYINYAEPGDSVVSNIYGANLARLQKIKGKYDPKNVFNKMHPIPMSNIL